MKKRYVTVAKEYGQEGWRSFFLPGGRSVTVIPREDFERACAAANKKLRQVAAEIRLQTKESFQRGDYGL